MSREPLKKFKSGAAFSIDVAVWAGEKGCTISFQKRVKVDEKQEDGTYYKTMKSLFKNEVLVVAHLLQQALSFADEYDQKQYESKNGGAQNSMPIAPVKKKVDDDEDIPF